MFENHRQLLSILVSGASKKQATFHVLFSLLQQTKRDPTIGPLLQKSTHPSRIQEILSWWAMSENYQQLLSILVEHPRNSYIPCLV